MKFDVIFTYELTYSTRITLPNYALLHEDEGLTYAEPLCTDIKFVIERLESKSPLNLIEIRSAVSNTKHALRQQPSQWKWGTFCSLADELKESWTPLSVQWLGYQVGGPEFECPPKRGIPLFSKASRPASGPTPPCVQFVQGAPSLGVKQPRPEADHLRQRSAGVKNKCSYTSTPLICL